MIVIYTDPADGAVHEYDADALTCGESDAISRAIDLPWPMMSQALRNQAPQAMRGIAWAWRKRAEPTLRFTHFDPLIKSLKAKFADDDIPDFLAMLDRSKSFSPPEREQARDEVIAKAMDPDAARQIIAEHLGASPKDETENPSPSPSDSSDTSS